MIDTLFSWGLLQPGAIAFFVQSIWCAAIMISLLSTHRKSNATWLLAGYFAAFMVTSLLFTAVLFFFDASLIRFDYRKYLLPLAVWIILFGLVVLGQFAYHFPCVVMAQRREATVVRITTVGLLLVDLLLLLTAFRLPSFDPRRIGPMFGLTTLGMLAVAGIFMRRTLFFSEADRAAHHAFLPARLWAALRYPSGKSAQASQRFLLTILSNVLLSLWSAIYFTFMVNVIPHYVFILVLHLGLGILFFAFFLTYLNYTPATYPFLAKFILSTLFTVLIVIMFIGEATLYRAYSDYAAIRQADLRNVVARLASPIPLTASDLPATVQFLASVAPDRNDFIMRAVTSEGSRNGHLNRCVYKSINRLVGICVLHREHAVALVQFFEAHGRAYALGFALAPVQRYLAENMTPTLLALCGSLFFIVILFPIFFRVNLMMPLQDLLRGVQEVQAGNLKVVIPIHYQDELGCLTESFNHMVRTIDQVERQLQESNRTLEQRVADRTQDLSQALANLQAAQRELIQAEKMAALGKLIANIAHEINTPLGAIRASTENIARALNETTRDLPPLLRALPSDHHYEQFCALLVRATQPKPAITSREERAHRRAVQRELEAAGIANADSIADTFVDMGIYADVTPLLALLRSEQVSSILQAAYHLASQHHHSANILAAVERISKIVFALKSYAHSEASGEAVSARVTDGLEVVLTLYYNQLKHRIEVVKQYADVPPIRCYPDELNQVWTNLIHNAIQAMQGKGRLEIGVKTCEVSETSQVSAVIVEITDSGPGIPDAIKDRIFEPFFTTKPAGEGSGLGLDICKKIIDKHHGKIDFDSQPGRTTFRVWLPMLTQANKPSS